MIDLRIDGFFEEPPGKVFDFLCDMALEPNWNPDVRKFERVSTGPIAAGQRARVIYRGLGTIDILALRVGRPRVAEFAAFGNKMDTKITFSFEEENGGTRLSTHLAIQPKGPFRFTAPLVKSKLQQMFDRRVDQVRECLRNYNWREQEVLPETRDDEENAFDAVTPNQFGGNVEPVVIERVPDLSLDICIRPLNLGNEF